MADYLDSLDRLLAQRPGTIYPAHGLVVPAGAAKLSEYRAHRLQSQQRVLASPEAFKAPATPAQLVPGAYPHVAPQPYPPAAPSPLPHPHHPAPDGPAPDGP